MASAMYALFARRDFMPGARSSTMPTAMGNESHFSAQNVTRYPVLYALSLFYRDYLSVLFIQCCVGSRNLSTRM